MRIPDDNEPFSSDSETAFKPVVKSPKKRGKPLTVNLHSDSEPEFKPVVKSPNKREKPPSPVDSSTPKQEQREEKVARRESAQLQRKPSDQKGKIEARVEKEIKWVVSFLKLRLNFERGWDIFFKYNLQTNLFVHLLRRWKLRVKSSVEMDRRSKKKKRSLLPWYLSKGLFTRYDFIACDKLTTGLRHELFRVNQTYNSLTTLKSCRRPVVSLSHASKSCRVNRP